jgi:hypothetical protein
VSANSGTLTSIFASVAHPARGPQVEAGGYRHGFVIVTTRLAYALIWRIGAKKNTGLGRNGRSSLARPRRGRALLVLSRVVRVHVACITLQRRRRWTACDWRARRPGKRPPLCLACACIFLALGSAGVVPRTRTSSHPFAHRSALLSAPHGRRGKLVRPAERGDAVGGGVLSRKPPDVRERHRRHAALRYLKTRHLELPALERR